MLEAGLTSGGQLVSKIGPGLMVLCGITHDDSEVDIDYCVGKLLKLRLWSDPIDQNKAWHCNVVERQLQILLVSQFTLYHKLNGNKPDFHGAMANEQANELYNIFLVKLEQEYLKMQKALKQK